MPTGVGVAVHPQLGDTRAAAAPPPFVPTDIAGLVIWLDPSDSATTFQDEAGTVPAVSGDPVARINDLSAGGNNAVASADAKRPIRHNESDLWWLEFDGVDDCLATASFVVNATDGEATVCMAIEVPEPAALGINFERSANYGASSDGLVSYANTDGTTDVGVSGAGGVNAYSFADLQGARLVLSIKYDKSIAVGAQMAVYKDGSLLVGSEVAGNNSGGVFASEPLFFGMRNDTNLPLAMKSYGFVIYDSLLSDSDRESVEAYMATKCGITI